MVQENGNNDKKQKNLLLVSGFFAYTLHRVLELPDEEVDLQGRFRLIRLKVGHYDIREHIAEMIHHGQLLLLISLLVQLQQIFSHTTDFSKGFDDRECHCLCMLALKYCRQHI